MYKQYLNDYEKRAEQIRRAARAVENNNPTVPAPPIIPIKEEMKIPQKNNVIAKKEGGGLGGLLERFSSDDILILALLFLLISSEDKDMTLIIILGYLFLSGL